MSLDTKRSQHFFFVKYYLYTMYLRDIYTYNRQKKNTLHRYIMVKKLKKLTQNTLQNCKLYMCNLKINNLKIIGGMIL